MLTNRFRLSQRIVLSVALSLAIVLALFGLLAYWTVQQATSSEYAARLRLTQVLAAQTDASIQTTQNTLFRAALRVSEAPDNSASDAFDATLRPLLGPDGPFSSVVVLGDTSQVLWSASSEPGVNAHRSLVAWNALPLIEAARSAAFPAAGECPDDAFPQHPALCIAAVLTKAGAAQMLVAEVDANGEALPLLPSTGSQTDADVQVLDSKGIVIASTSPGDVGSPTEHFAVLQGVLGSTRSAVVVHRPGPDESFPDHLVSYVPLGRVPGWSVVAEVRQDQVLATPQVLAERLLALGVAAVLLAALVAWTDVRRVVRPLQQLTAVAERFAAGNLESPVTMQRHDELGLLASAFETMRRRLQASLAETEQGRRELEQRVEQRTAQVAEQNRRLEVLNAEASRLNAILEQRTVERAALLSRVLSAQEGERERIARDLHDSTGQSLAAVLLSLELLEDELPEALTSVRQRLERSRTLAASTLSELRALIAGLRPALLDDLGLAPALRAYAAQRLEEQGTVVDVSVSLPHRLPPTVEIALFRIVQEALNNVAKHAQARHVAVQLTETDGGVMATIVDDGLGFDTDRVRADARHGEHVGLLGMRERAELLGGQLTISASAGKGTTVRVTVPLTALEVVAP